MDYPCYSLKNYVCGGDKNTKVYIRWEMIGSNKYRIIRLLGTILLTGGTNKTLKIYNYEHERRGLYIAKIWIFMQSFKI